MASVVRKARVSRDELLNSYDRFGTKARKLRTKLKAIEDEVVLTELATLAATCPDLDSFRKQLSP